MSSTTLVQARSRFNFLGVARQAVYKTEVERKTNFLGIVEVRPTLKYEVDAVSGQVLVEEKPWYLKLLPFLFK